MSNHMDKYARGYCAEFAVALHRLHGLPLVAFVEVHYDEFHKEEFDTLIHAGVMSQSGLFLDCRGGRLQDEVAKHLLYSDTTSVQINPSRCALRKYGNENDFLNMFNVDEHLVEIAIDDIEEITREPSAYEGAIYDKKKRTEEPGTGCVNDFYWFEDELDLEEFLHDGVFANKEDAGDWAQSEIDAWAHDGDPNRFDDMIHERIHNPVIVVMENGKPYIWDGWHRVGFSFYSGKDSIPAIIGIPLH